MYKHIYHLIIHQYMYYQVIYVDERETIRAAFFPPK